MCSPFNCMVLLIQQMFKHLSRKIYYPLCQAWLSRCMQDSVFLSPLQTRVWLGEPAVIPGTAWRVMQTFSTWQSPLKSLCHPSYWNGWSYFLSDHGTDHHVIDWEIYQRSSAAYSQDEDYWLYGRRHLSMFGMPVTHGGRSTTIRLYNYLPRDLPDL